MEDRGVCMSGETRTGEDVSTTDRSTVGRRLLLQALGLGTVAAAGGVASATGGTDTTGDTIDPLYGYPVPDAEMVGNGDVPAADHEVTLHVGEPSPEEHGPLFHFDPTGLAVGSGDVVQFTFTTPDHTVTPYHPAHGFQKRVPDGVPPFSSPIVNAGGAWLYRFDEPGVYDLYCGPHHILGMAMRIVVGDVGADDVPAYEDTFEGDPGAPTLAPFSAEFLEREMRRFSAPGENVRIEWVWPTPQEVLDADALDPLTIQDEGPVSFDTVFEQLERFESRHANHDR